MDPKKVIAAFGHGIPDKKMQEIKDPALQNDLLVLEEQEGSVNFKFGVLAALSGQTTDDEMFSNEFGTPAFEEFYKTLGDVTPLKGFTGYRGGLDNSNGSTGDYCVCVQEIVASLHRFPWCQQLGTQCCPCTNSTRRSRCVGFHVWQPGCADWSCFLRNISSHL